MSIGPSFGQSLGKLSSHDYSHCPDCYACHGHLMCLGLVEMVFGHNELDWHHLGDKSVSNESQAHHWFFPLHDWMRNMFLLPLPQADSDIMAQKNTSSLTSLYSFQSVWKLQLILPAKLPFSKSGTEDEGIGQASRLQNLRFFCEQLKPKSASERYQTGP